MTADATLASLPRHDPVRAFGLGLLTVAFWSTVATAFKLTLRHADTVQMLFYATLTSAVSLLVIVALRGESRALLADARLGWRQSLVAGTINPCVYYLVLFAAYDRLPAQVAQPINYTWAIVVAVLSAVVLKQRIRAVDYVAGATCYLGVVVIATGGQVTGITVDRLGLALALGSTLIWAGYWILVMRDTRGAVTGMCLNFLVAVPVSALLCAFTSGFDVPLPGLAGSIYVGLFEMSLAFVCWSVALRSTDNASRVSYLIFLAPFVSLVLIGSVLDEPVAATTWTGLILIVAGLLAQQLLRRPG